MPLNQERGWIVQSGGERARRPHAFPRLSPRLEALETRCLMSDLAALHAVSPTLPRPNGAEVRTLRSDDDSRYPSVSFRGAGNAGVLLEPAHASYVIVPESEAPHSTLATAQVLPDLPFFGVIGNLGPDGPPDLFAMTLDAKTAGVQLELVTQQPAASPAVQFALYDATGRVLGTWTAGGQPVSGSDAVSLQFPSQSLTTTIYLGIAVPSAGGSGPVGSLPGGSYQLWVTRLAGVDRASGTTTGTGDGPAAMPSPTSAQILGPFPGAASPPPGQQVQAAASSAAGAGAGAGLGLALAGGSLPTRAAGPLGGVLASGDTSQAAVRRLTVRVNREGDERVLHPFQGDPAVATGPQVESGPEGDARALVAIPGPGGFPLLGATAIGNWRRLPGRALVAAEPEITAGAPTAAAASAPAPTPETWGLSRGPSSFGLTTATFLTLNAILSDPVAGFDYLATCLDSEEAHRAQSAAKVRRA
jgi:hypothetical protein